MSVLLYMPVSGGNPLESVIMTSFDEDENAITEVSPTISRFDLKDGKPVRKLSSDSHSMDLSVYSVDLPGSEDADDGVSSVGEEDGSSKHSRQRPASPNSQTASTSSNREKSNGTTTSAVASSSASSTPPRIIPDPKQPQLRLTPVGAILGAGGGAKMVKAVTNAQERRVQRKQEQKDYQKSAAASRVHMGFYV